MLNSEWTRRGVIAGGTASLLFPPTKGFGFRLRGGLMITVGPEMSVLNLNPGKAIRQCNVIQQNLAAGSTTVLYSASPGVPGYINSVLLVQERNSCNDDLLQFFIDGEGTPSLQFDCGSILGHNVPTGTALRAGTQHAWSAFVNDGVLQHTLAFSFPVPYKSSIIVKYVVSPSDFTQVFCDIEDIQGVTLPYKLLSVNQTNVSPAVITQAQLNATNGAAGGLPPFMNVSGAGWVVFFSLATRNVTNWTFIENRPCFFLNGNTYNGTNRADWDSDGLEGLSWDGWAYEAGVPFSRPEAAVIQTTAGGDFTLAVDFLTINEGIPFTNGCYMTWQPKPPGAAQATTGVTAAWLVLYYVNNP